MNKLQVSLFAAITIVVSSLINTISNEHFRWLAFNGVTATSYSNELFENRKVKVPDALIDKIIHFPADGEVVYFSEHWGFYSYAYSPNNRPEDVKHSWSQLIGSWYVGKPET
jgi:hypothetical protein